MRYQYKVVRLSPGPEFSRLYEGTYEPPIGWRLVSVSPHRSAWGDPDLVLTLERIIDAHPYRDQETP